MRIDFSKVKSFEKIDYIGDLNFYNNTKSLKTIKDYKSVEGVVEIQKADSVIIVKYDIHAVLNVLSTLSGEEFEYPLDVNETLYYTDKKEMDNEDVFYVKEGYVDLDQEIYSLIITSIPLILHKEGEEYPKGKNYRVISEDEIDENDGSNYSPFDKLKDLDL